MIHSEDLILCELCGAVTTYDSRRRHVAWHARLNARTHSMSDQDHITWDEAKEIATEVLLSHEAKREALANKEWS